MSKVTTTQTTTHTITCELSELEAQQLRAILSAVETGPLDDLYGELDRQLPESDLDVRFEHCRCGCRDLMLALK